LQLDSLGVLLGAAMKISTHSKFRDTLDLSDRKIYGRHGPVEMPRSTIDLALSLYRPEFRYCTAARFTQKSLQIEAEIDGYHLAQDGLLSYVTAPLMMLLISQAGYIFLAGYASGLIEHTRFPNVSMKEFLEIRNSGGILISQIRQLTFNSKVLLPSKVTISVFATSIHKAGNSFVTRTPFVMNDGAAEGTFDTYVSLVGAH
jgi:hypothetical protein